MNNKNSALAKNVTQEILVYEQRPEDFAPKVEVGATYVDVNGKLLLLELAHSKLEAGAWGVPAGKLKANEMPVNGARRELFEETGIEIISVDLFQSLGQLYIRKPDIDYVYHLFSIKLDKLPNIHLSDEHQSYKWVTQLETERLNLMNGAKYALDLYYRQTSKKVRSGASVNAYLILRQENAVLLHLRKNTGYCDNCYGLVSGHVEDEEPASTAIIREAYEEASIHLEPESLKAVHTMHRRTNRLNIDIFFECTAWQGTIINREPDKCAALEYFPLEQLPSNIIDYVERALEAISEGKSYSEIGWE